MTAKKALKFDYVIIGNSAAGIGAVEGIRNVDAKGSIAIISDERYHTYSRPLISYYLGKKVTSDSNMYYRPKGFYKHHGVEALLGRKVVSIDKRIKELVLADGTKIAFKKLMVATGGAPFVPPIKDLEGEDVYTFTTWDEAKKVAKAAGPDTTAVVIGGGLIGLKAAEGLIEIGVKVTIVELADRIFSTILDVKGSKMFETHLKNLGSKVITGDTVTAIKRKAESGKREKGKGKEDRVTGVVLKSGKEIACDMVIVAIGVVPNTALAKTAGIKMERGIIVDGHLRTSEKDIYAAGDVVETFDVLRKVRRPQPIWPNAYTQGYAAGLNMAGFIFEYEGSFGMNSVEVCGLPTITVGMYDAAGKGFEEIVKSGPEKDSYKKIILKDDRIVGAVFVGDIDRAGIVTGLIKDRVKVSDFKKYLLTDEFGYAVFPKELRKERLYK